MNDTETNVATIAAPRRTKGRKKALLQVYMEPELRESLFDYARQEGEDASIIVRQLIRAAVKRQ